MNVLERILSRLGLRPGAERTFAVDEALLVTLQDLAVREQIPTGEVATRLLSEALEDRWLSEDLWERWKILSRREQQITAFICLEYTNREIAARLNISPETVKTHVSRILEKFNQPSRQSLRMLLRDWDFRQWEKE